MFTCPNPSCRKALPSLTRTCTYCKADLSLLVDYSGQLDSALGRADRLTRAGELGAAVWAYLEVLEIDPDNTVARRQVGRVAGAVREFDRLAPGRKWQAELRGLASGDRMPAWLRLAIVLLMVAAAFLLGFLWSQGDLGW